MKQSKQWHLNQLERVYFRYCNSLKTLNIKEKTAGGYHVIDEVLFKETEIIHYPSKKDTIHSYSFCTIFE